MHKARLPEFGSAPVIRRMPSPDLSPKEWRRSISVHQADLSAFKDRWTAFDNDELRGNPLPQ
jgi:hypothetical protein